MRKPSLVHSGLRGAVLGASVTQTLLARIKHAREIGQAATLVVELESVAFEMLPIKRKRTGIDSTGALRALRFRNPIITS